MLDLVKNLAFPGEVALFSDGPFRQALEATGASVAILESSGLARIGKRSSFGSACGSLPSLLRLTRRVAALAESKDVIYANTQKAFFVSALAALGRRSQVVWHLRDMLTASHFKPWLSRCVVYLANHRAAAVVANSRATKDAFIEAGGRSDRISVVHNGLSPEPFDVVEEPEIVRSRASLNAGNAFLVGVFGRLSPWKGQHVLLEALEALPPDIHAVVVGEALFGERAYIAALQEQTRRPRLQGRVHLLGFRKDIPLLMKTVDAVVHTSVLPEPFGRVIVEGMLAQRPVVATAAGGATEIIEDGVSGVLTPPGDASALGAALLRLKNDAALRNRLAATGNARARQYFSLEATVSGVKRVLEAAWATR